MKKILIVEDNKDYREVVEKALKKQGYEVDQTENPIRGLELVARNTYDVVISDLNLPVMSGVLFTESVKNLSPQTKTIILTGNPDDDSELEAIDKDIDLYIEKTRSLPVILRYIETLIEESKPIAGRDVFITSRKEGIVINETEHIVYKNDEPIDLTPKEYEMLKLLIVNKNKVVSRADFIENIWQEPSEEVDERLIDTHIKKIRSKLGTVSLMTVRGYGYRWNEIE